jgi:hypothetical protein
MVFIFKSFEIKLLKIGKILQHTTKSAGKVYSKAKLYLRNDKDINSKYELYDLGRIHLAEWHGHVKGKGLLIFIPDKPRPKKNIRM